MKTALVLSGGGANGSFQAGAIKRLVELGESFDCVAGVSVGSLNGAMVAQGDYDKLFDVWKNVQTKDIYHKYSTIQIIWRLLVEGKTSMYNATPLRELIGQNISLAKSKIPFYLGLTSLFDGQYHSLTQSDFDFNEDFRDAVYASSLMPLLWEPTHVLLKDGMIADAVDGGLRNVTPLKDIIKENPDKIIIISCHADQMEEKHSNNIIDIAKRTFLDIMLTEVVENDVNGILFVNQLVKQAEAAGTTLRHPKTGRVLKYFEVEFIKPPVKLGDSAIFDHPRLDANFELGYKSVGR